MLEFEISHRLPAEIFAAVFDSDGKRSVAALMPCLLSAGEPYAPDIRARYLAEIDRAYAGEIDRLLIFWSEKNPDLSDDEAFDLAAALTAIPDPVCAVFFYRAIHRRDPSKAEVFRANVLNMLEDDADGFARMAFDKTLRSPIPMTGRVPVKAYPALILCSALKPRGVDFNTLAEAVAAMLRRKWIPLCDEALEKFAAEAEKENLRVLPPADLSGFGSLAESVRKRLSAGKTVPEKALLLFERLSARQSEKDAKTTASCLWIIRHAETAQQLANALKERDFHRVNEVAERIPVNPLMQYPDMQKGVYRLAPDFEAAAAAGKPTALGIGEKALLSERAADLLMRLGLSAETAALWRLKMPDLIHTVCKEEGAGHDMSRTVSLFSENVWLRAVSALEGDSDGTSWRRLPARYAYAFRTIIDDYESLKNELTVNAQELEKTLREVKGLPAAGRHFFVRMLNGQKRAEALSLIGTEAWNEAGGGALHTKVETVSWGSGSRKTVIKSLWDDLIEAFEKTSDRGQLGRLASVLLPMYPIMAKLRQRRPNNAALRKALLAGAVSADMLRTGMTTEVFSNFICSNFSPAELEMLKASAKPDKEYGKVICDLISRRLAGNEEIIADIFERKRNGVAPYRTYRPLETRDNVFDFAVRILQSKMPVIRASKPISNVERLMMRKSIQTAAEMSMATAPRLSAALSLLNLLGGLCASALEALVSESRTTGLNKKQRKDLQLALIGKLPAISTIMKGEYATQDAVSVADSVLNELKKAGIANPAAGELVLEIFCERDAEKSVGTKAEELGRKK